MARNKDYPIVKQLRVASPPGPSSTLLVNADRYLSKANRRLYRHARNYNLKIDIDPSSSTVYDIYALADNWMNRNALKMAYDSYLMNSEDERAALKEANLARWSDFRTYQGVGSTAVNPVIYDGYTPHTLTSGEFILTKVYDNAGVERFYTWGGTAADRYGIIDEYAKAGQAQPSPDTTTGDMPYDNLMSDNDADMADDLQTDGNLPPYEVNPNLGIGAAWIKVGVLSAHTVAQKLSTGYFDAPCGFVLIREAGGEPVDATRLSVTFREGDYKGVHAPSMLE